MAIKTMYFVEVDGEKGQEHDTREAVMAEVKALADSEGFSDKIEWFQLRKLGEASRKVVVTSLTRAPRGKKKEDKKKA